MKSTIEALQGEIDRLTGQNQSYAKQLEILRRERQSLAPYAWIGRYLAWSKSLFGRPVAPIIDNAVKCVASFDVNSEYFKLAAPGVFEAESVYVKNLLATIKEKNIPGGIVEFGIYRGDWINKLYALCQAVGLEREIWGFDSFQGLSAPDPERDNSYWKKGMFAAPIDEVRNNLKTAERPNIRLVAGFFSESLSAPEAQSLQQIAYARIDCDIYPPTVECLRFLGPRLSHGAVLVFDDWSHNIEIGEARAFAEWVPTVPDLQWEFLFYGGWDHFYLRAWHRGRSRD